MNNSQKTISSTLAKLGAQLDISDADLQVVVRKRMADMKAAHEAKN